MPYLRIYAVYSIPASAGLRDNPTGGLRPPPPYAQRNEREEARDATASERPCVPPTPAYARTRSVPSGRTPRTLPRAVSGSEGPPRRRGGYRATGLAATVGITRRSLPGHIRRNACPARPRSDAARLPPPWSELAKSLGAGIFRPVWRYRTGLVTMATFAGRRSAVASPLGRHLDARRLRAGYSAGFGSCILV